jgi:hypothetical protein
MAAKRKAKKELGAGARKKIRVGGKRTVSATYVRSGGRRGMSRPAGAKTFVKRRRLKGKNFSKKGHHFIRSGGGAPTYSKFVKKGRANMYKKYRLLAQPQYLRAQISSFLTGLEGRQSVSTVVLSRQNNNGISDGLLFGGGTFDITTLQALADKSMNETVTNGNYFRRYQLNWAKSKVRFRNAVTAACKLTLYHVLARRDNAGTNPVSAWQQGAGGTTAPAGSATDVNNQTLANVVAGQDNEGWTRAGSKPFTSSLFTHLYRVMKSETIVLQPGAEHTLSIALYYNKAMHPQYDIYGAIVGGLSYYLMAVVEGQMIDYHKGPASPIGDAAYPVGANQTITTAPVKLDVIADTIYKISNIGKRIPATQELGGGLDIPAVGERGTESQIVPATEIVAVIAEA